MRTTVILMLLGLLLGTCGASCTGTIDSSCGFRSVGFTLDHISTTDLA